MTPSSILYLLAALSAANAITITGYVSIPCYSNSIAVGTCTNIGSNLCCTFPRGGNQVQGTYFSNLYSGTVGVFYKTSATAFCSVTRASAGGPSSGVCLNGGTLSSYFGGGAAWFDCTTCSRSVENSRRSLSDEALQAIAANSTCTGMAIPTLFGWEGEGVWVLKLQEGPDWDRYNELPVTTNVRNLLPFAPGDHLVVDLISLLANTYKEDIHIENMKAFGAKWYPNARDHPDAAEVLDREG